jgi:hypothetical protein
LTVLYSSALCLLDFLVLKFKRKKCRALKSSPGLECLLINIMVESSKSILVLYKEVLCELLHNSECSDISESVSSSDRDMNVKIL